MYTHIPETLQATIVNKGLKGFYKDFPLISASIYSMNTA